MTLRSGFVLDCSMALSWYLPDEKQASSDAVFKLLGDVPGWVPALWQLEFSNAMVMASRRQRINAAYVRKSIDHALKLPLRTDLEMPDPLRLIELAERLRLTVYEAVYLELAQRQQLPLVTLDKALVRAAKTLGLQPKGSLDA